MRPTNRCLALLLPVLLAACSSAPRPSIPLDLHYQRKLDVPFFAQQTYHCGPAALAETAVYRGVDTHPDSLADKVFVPGRKGAFTVEMRAASRRLGLMPFYLRGGLPALLTEVDAGNPVLVLQNLGLSWWPTWHYAVVVGYDRADRSLLLHSGTRAYYRVAMTTFLETWQRANYWAIVPVSAQQVPATADLNTYLRAALEFEQTGELARAIDFYRRAEINWPMAKPALLALANAHLANDDPVASMAVYRKALQTDPQDPMLWNNYAFALLRAECGAAAMNAVSRALLYADGDPRYQQSASEIREAMQQRRKQPLSVSCPSF
ncbi:PA2778 family cysteine peptidase [Spongiibacter nanhainus]|uniref:PA2778 family cysteine peptidase n=1 Tax=Spongiibacter nanhainus TaxID=2794344 RepID=A0A7T4R0S4_9GAMM|nr:PA2778 family cysteine peptidase [Spongiibacter nanhainus]QQD18167.1 PA2778 family cysteine peptidase [Spongiibacter nanhainus]